VGRLNTLQAVRRELSRVYREARTGKIDTADASRLGFLLVSLAKIMESSDLEQRIEALEKLKYDGFIGCEYIPRGDTDEGLSWMKRMGLQ